MEPLLVLLTVGLATTARAQFVVGLQGEGSPSALCNKTFANANATGIFSFNPQVNQGPQEDQPDNDSHYALNAQWGVSVFDIIGGPNATAEVSAWYNTNGANYSDNGGLWYDVCVITVNTLSFNSYARGVNDKGDCLETLDQDCVDALNEQAEGFITGLIGNPTPNPGSNMTAGSLSHICYDVGNAMTENFPKQCKKFFDGDATVFGSSMTTSSAENGSFLYDGCTLMNEEENTTFHFATGSAIYTSQYTEEQQIAVYGNITTIVIPALTVFLPIADIEATTSIANVNSIMTCAHVNNINADSLQPNPPPEPTPIGGGGSLSGGAIAGIVIGVLAGLGLVLGALWFYWIRKRRASKKDKAVEQSDQAPPTYAADAKLAEAPDNAPTELGGAENQVQYELPTQKSWHTSELPGDVAHEKAVGPPAELPAGEK